MGGKSIVHYSIKDKKSGNIYKERVALGTGSGSVCFEGSKPRQCTQEN